MLYLQSISLLLLLAASFSTVLGYDRVSAERERDRRLRSHTLADDTDRDLTRPEVSSWRTGRAEDRHRDRTDRYSDRYGARHWQRPETSRSGLVPDVTSGLGKTESTPGRTEALKTRPAASEPSESPSERRWHQWDRTSGHHERRPDDRRPWRHGDRVRSPPGTAPTPSAEDEVVPELGPQDHRSSPEELEPYEELTENRTVTRQGKFLSLLKLVRFTNFVCNATSGSNGTCYTSAECANLGGVEEGACASGYGVCCVLIRSCGESTSTNNTYFVNANYPSSFDGTGSCQLQITKANSNICQLRLDFDIFNLAQPETSNHLCLNDQFVVDAASPVPSICGMNTGNHMYIDTGVLNTSAPITLSVVTSGVTYARSWKIRVSHIPCNELYTAEPGCLQYHTGVSGKLQSFNFDFTSGLQLSNQDYAVCVRMERNFCGIQYQPCTDASASSTGAFSLGGSTATAVNAVTGNNCNKDWLIIPCASDNVNTPLTSMSDGNVCVDRLCGDQFNTVTGSTASAAAYSYTKPFRLFYHTDSQEAASTPTETDNRGFCLDYVQQPCTS